MISTVVLLVYFMTETVLNDPDVIAYRAWQSKMVSATFVFARRNFPDRCEAILLGVERVLKSRESGSTRNVIYIC